jgi:hypothetical protein
MLRKPSSPTGGPFGQNKLVYNDEYLATEIGQTGTQFDGLGHIGIQLGKDAGCTVKEFHRIIAVYDRAKEGGKPRQEACPASPIPI